jgi:universal stress protein E
VRWDNPAYEGIIRQVLRHEPILLIAQSTPKGRAARLLLTQTDYKLIESCPCPLLLIKNRRPYLDPSVIAAVDPGHVHAKPAVLDQVIVDSAGMISNALSGKLLIFHARTPWNDAVRVTPELQSLPEAVSDEIHAAYCDRIEDQVMELAQDHDVPRRCVHIVEGYAARLLPGVAHREAADIVAMGAVSRSPLKRVLIGHTAERVLDALDCDVLIVKPPGFRSKVRRQSAHRVERSVAPARAAC